MIREQVQKELAHLLKTPITLLIPKNREYGDFAFHIQQLTKNNNVSTVEIIKKLQTSTLFDTVEEVDGFINVFLNPKVLVTELSVILDKKSQYGVFKKNNIRINIEYGDPNTHKLPHIGHLFSYIVGESWARILEATGNTIYRTSYQGDVGLHVAKCLYEAQENKQKITTLKTLQEKVLFLQKCYQTGSKKYDEDKNVKVEIDKLNKKIYDKDSSIYDLWHKTRSWSLEYYKEFEDRLGITYNKHYFESETAKIGKKIVLDNLNTVFIEDNGAVIFQGEKYGLHTRVFINKFGNPTYEAKDLGLMTLKMQDWQFDKAIITTASEQNAYFKVLIEAMSILMPELKGKVVHFGFGMIDLKLGKMSSRTGNIISGVELVDTIVKEVKKIMKGDDTTNIIAEKIGLASIKYAFLKSEAKKNIQFDVKESIATVGNSAPYILYTYARTQSIVEKTDNKIQTPINIPSHLETEELELLHTLTQFPSVVSLSSENFAPHLICNYLFECAKLFNVLYEKHSILKAPHELKHVRLALTKSTGYILKTGLSLLGIEAIPHI